MLFRSEVGRQEGQREQRCDNRIRGQSDVIAEGEHEPRHTGASRRWKGAGTDSPLEAAGGAQLCQHLDLTQ